MNKDKLFEALRHTIKDVISEKEEEYNLGGIQELIEHKDALVDLVEAKGATDFIGKLSDVEDQTSDNESEIESLQEDVTALRDRVKTLEEIVERHVDQFDMDGSRMSKMEKRFEDLKVWLDDKSPTPQGSRIDMMEKLKQVLSEALVVIEKA